MDLVIEVQNDWRDVGRPQVAMHREIFATFYSFETGQEPVCRCSIQGAAIKKPTAQNALLSQWF